MTPFTTTLNYRYVVGINLAWLSVCHAFLAPRVMCQKALWEPTNSALPLLGGFTSSLLTADDITVDQAFSDSIVTFDGPIRNMAIGFAVVVLVLAGLKVLTDQMDAAIEKVLVDYEATLKRFFPQRWELIAEQLVGLDGDERDIKLLALIEALQESDPAFMARVKEKMTTK
jgi:hypothetical protein